jgi:hypothetical protein
MKVWNIYLFYQSLKLQKWRKHLFLVALDLGRRGFESLLECDSKAPPPQVYPQASSHTGSYKGWRQDDANASGFKVSLLFGGRSKEGIGGNYLRYIIPLPPMDVSVEREPDKLLGPPGRDPTTLVISAPSSCR